MSYKDSEKLGKRRRLLFLGADLPSAAETYAGGVQIFAASKRAYEVVSTSRIGDRVFTDRQYMFTNMGGFSAEAGFTYVRVANDDKGTGPYTVQFTLSVPWPATVYLVYYDLVGNSHNSHRPWIFEEGWTLATVDLPSWDARPKFFEVREKVFPAGKVPIKGNNGGGGKGSPLVFVRPRDGVVQTENIRMPDGVGDAEEAAIARQSLLEPSTEFAQKALALVSEGCTLFAREVPDPSLKLAFLMAACEAAAKTLGLGGGDDGVRLILTSVCNRSDDPEVSGSLQDIEHTLDVEAGTVLSFWKPFLAEPSTGGAESFLTAFAMTSVDNEAVEAASNVQKRLPDETSSPEHVRRLLCRALVLLREVCVEPAFLAEVAEPDMIVSAFVAAAIGPAVACGFGEGDESVRNLLAAIQILADDQEVAALLSDIEATVNLGSGALVLLAEDLALMPIAESSPVVSEGEFLHPHRFAEESLALAPAVYDTEQSLKDVATLGARVAEALRRVRVACGRHDCADQVSDPVSMIPFFVQACETPATECGFGEGEDGLRNLFDAFLSCAEDRNVRKLVEDIEMSMAVAPGTVLGVWASVVTGTGRGDPADGSATTLPPFVLQLATSEGAATLRSLPQPSVLIARQALELVRDSCVEFSAQAPGLTAVVPLLDAACAAATTMFGVGEHDDGVRLILASVCDYATDPAVSCLLQDIEHKLDVEPGAVLNTWRPMQAEPRVGEADPFDPTFSTSSMAGTALP